MTETQLPGKLKMAASIWDCRWAAIGGFVVGLFVAVLFFSRGDSRRSLRVTVPTNGGPVSIDLAAENDTMNQVDVLNQLFTDEFSKPGMLAWLANEGIHEIASPQLAAALVNHCDPIPPEPLAEMLAKQQECEAKPVVKALRDLARTHSRPFHFVGREVDIGVPAEEDQPAEGRANTCSGGDFEGRNVELTNPINNKRVTVRASGSYLCTGVGRTAHIQLSQADAFRVFDGPLDKYEQAIAVVVP